MYVSRLEKTASLFKLPRMAAEYWWRITDQQISEGNSGRKAPLFWHQLFFKFRTINHGRRFAQSQLRKIRLNSFKRLDSFFVPSCIQSLHLYTAEATTVVHLFPHPFFACLWYISVVLLLFCPCILLRRFEQRLLSLPPTIAKRHYVCVIASVTMLLLWR